MFDWECLREWFLDAKRELPWRNKPSPYAVWISEVMLQQTQVSVVIPYFERWMLRFPTIKALAEASLDEVIKVWEGLGYYSRARNLHEAARYILEEHRGELPSTRDALSKIKGLGPYTIGAIQSFAFHQKAAAVDGNVVRVLTRYWRVEEDIAKAKTVVKLRETLEENLPNQEPWVVGEALIELGATVCQKKPKCSQCPIRKSCSGYIHGVAEQLPIKSSKVKYEQLYRSVAVIQHQDKFLVQRGQKGKIMSDLHEFPYLEISEKGLSDKKFSKHFSEQYGLDLTLIKPLSQVNHSFTRYRVQLTPTLFSAKDSPKIEGLQWHSMRDLESLAFSSGHRKIFMELKGVVIN